MKSPLRAITRWHLSPLLLLQLACLLTLSQGSWSEPKPPPAPKPFAWTGKWIWLGPEANPRNAFLYARKTFTLETLPRTAPIRVAADSRYKLFVNGQYIGRGPARFHPSDLYYDEYNVAQFLEHGNNVIALVVWHYGVPTFQSLEAPAGMLVEAQIGNKTLASDATWKVKRADAWRADTEKIDLQLPCWEEYDARKEPVGWEQRTFDDSQWETASVIGPAGRKPWVNLRPRDIPPLREQYATATRLLAQGKIASSVPAMDASKPLAVRMAQETLQRSVDLGPEGRPASANGLNDVPTPIRWTFSPDAEGTYFVLDFGREVSGYPRIRIDAPAGTIVDMGYSELLENGRVAMNRADVHYADRYICREGAQEHELFGPRAFRYLQVDVRNASRTVSMTVFLNDSGYPTIYRGQFGCSDNLLNQIWGLGRRTVELCMDDAYMDCPWRERGQWWGDSRVEGITTYYAFGDARLIRRAITQIAQGQRDDGITPGVYPADFDNRWLPDFCLIWMLTLDDYVHYTGEKALASELWPNVVKALAWFPKYADPQSGLLKNVPGWVFIDWADVDKKGECAPLNAYYIAALRAAARIGQLTGHSTEADRYRRQADQLAEKWNQRFWNETEGAYVDAYADVASKTVSEQTNALAILFDIAPRIRWDRMFARLDESQSKPTVRCGSPYFSFYWLWAMHRADRHQQALDYTRKHYGEMLKAGATSAWEVWNQSASLCHGWSSGPTNLLPAYIVGIHPDSQADGWTVTRLSPHLGDLQWVYGLVPTPLGEIEVRWEKNGDGLRATMRVPTGITLLLEASPVENVEVDGMPLQPTRTENGIVLYKLPEGSHRVDRSRVR